MTGRERRSGRFWALALAALVAGSGIGGAVALAGASVVAGTPEPDQSGPTADAGENRTVNEDTALRFEAETTGNDGNATYEWDFDGDGTADATGANVTHTFADPGVYESTLTVTDAAGNTATDSVTVTVLVVADVGPSGNDSDDDSGEQTPDGSGEPTPDGSGESTPDDSGESTPDGSGESTPDGSGESTPGESDGSTPDESDGSTPDESDGSAPGESDGSTPDESDGSAPDGSGESTPENTGTDESSTDETGTGDGSGSTGPSDANGAAPGDAGSTESEAASTAGVSGADVTVSTHGGVTDVHVEGGGRRDVVDLSDGGYAAAVRVDAVAVTTNASEYTLNVSARAGPPAGIPTPNRTEVGAATAGFVRVDHSLSNRSLAGATVSFTLGWDALSANVTASEVVLYRYRNGSWRPLETRFLEYTEDGARYEADTRGLSMFVVGQRTAPNVTVSPNASARRVALGDTVTVPTRVANDGTARGMVVVALRVDGVVLDTASTPLGPGETTTLELTAAFERTGEYDLVVDGTDAGTVTVVEAASAGAVTKVTGTARNATAPGANGTATAAANASESTPRATPTPTALPPAPGSDAGPTPSRSSERSAGDRAGGVGLGPETGALVGLAFAAALGRSRD